MAVSRSIFTFLRICPKNLSLPGNYAHVHSTSFLSRSDNTSQSGDQSDNTSSSSSSSDEEYEENIKNNILKASLAFVHEHGWSKDAIGAGAESLGYSSISRGLFQNSGISLVHHFQESCNKDLSEHLKSRRAAEEGETKESDAMLEIQGAVEARLRMLLPYLPHWPQAMALMATPPHTPASLKLLLNLADDICHHTGDKSVDMTWYTRRAAVAGLYVAGELSLVQDKSADYEETWAFLARRVDDLRDVKRCCNQADASKKQLEEISTATLTTMRNMFGLNSYSR